jgi:hypothetical protein
MAWKEYDKDEVPDKQADSLMIIIIVLCIIAVGMYALGKSDGKEDALKSNIDSCATVEILEDD